MKLIIKFSIMTVFLLGSTIACAGSSIDTPNQLPTVEKVSLDKYVGQWYAITTLPQFFTRKCVAQEAVYKLDSGSRIGVKNICTKKSGKRTSIRGYAKTTDISGVLALRFTSGFAGLFRVKADYNIIKLDPEYKYALIGGKDRKSLWLLSRTKEISESVYEEYTSRAHELGFDISKLIDSKF